MFKRILLAALVIVGVHGLADEYTDAWGPVVGARVEVFEMSDAAGTTRSAAELMGAKGLLVFYNRSVDW